MKSMLHEASSVAQAIEKAWVESGKPGEFTINILEPGQKGFFGLITKRPAIVSITFDPKKTQNRSERPQSHDRKQHQAKRQERFDERKTNGKGYSAGSQNQKENRQNSAPVRDLKSQHRNNVQDAEKGRHNAPEHRQQVGNQRQDRPEKSMSSADVWTPELAEQIKGWLQEINSAMQFSAPFEMSLDKKILYITFQSRVFPAEDERACYMSLAYVLMQFLKKTHKRKFHNCHIVLSTHGVNTHDKRSDSTSE